MAEPKEKEEQESNVEIYEDDDFVFEFDNEENDDWIRSPEVTAKNKSDFELFSPDNPDNPNKGKGGEDAPETDDTSA